MTIDHQPHATATFFELAIALASLAWRAISGLDHTPKSKDPAQARTEKILSEIIASTGGFTVINHQMWLKKITKCSIIALVILSILGLLFFGTGWGEFAGDTLFWGAIGVFSISLLVAGKAESARFRHLLKIDQKAALTIEKFSNGE